MKALLNVSSGQNEIVDCLLNIAEDMGDIKKLINLSYTSSYYKGSHNSKICLPLSPELVNTNKVVSK
jgi:hypothetical protein